MVIERSMIIQSLVHGNTATKLAGTNPRADVQQSDIRRRVANHIEDLRFIEHHVQLKKVILFFAPIWPNVFLDDDWAPRPPFRDRNFDVWVSNKNCLFRPIVDRN